MASATSLRTRCLSGPGDLFTLPGKSFEFICYCFLFIINVHYDAGNNSVHEIGDNVCVLYCINNKKIFINIYILSVYSLFSDRVGLPLHNILHLLLSWTSSLSISSLAISASTLSNHVVVVYPLT